MDTPVIDFHFHVGSATRAGLYAYPENYIRIMDAAGVDRACINSIWFGEARHGNDLVADTVAQYPDRFIGVAFVTPHYPEEMVPELERAFDILGMKFLKIYPDFLGRPIDDPAYFPVFEWCNDRGLAVLSHGTFGFDDRSVSVPKRFAGLAERFPRVSWVLAHAGAGGSSTSERAAVEAARTVPNLYLETAATKGEHGALEAVVDAVGADRILYGSDMPVFDARHQVGRIVTADIPDEDKKKILGLNAIKLLGLEE